MKIVAFTGMPFSGKTEAVQIATSLDIPVVRMGDTIWDEVKKRGLDLNDVNVGKVANQMRKKCGMEIWAKKTLSIIQQMKNTDSIVIDGIRNVEEIDVFKKELGQDFVVIAIHASKKIRYKRAMNRGRFDDSNDIEAIKARDQREIKWGISVVIASADIVISNEGTIDEFRDKIKNILRDLQ